MFVYVLIVSGTEKVYVGKTNDVDRRFKEHTRNLRNSRHTNSELQDYYDGCKNVSLDIVVVFEGTSNDCSVEEERLISHNYSKVFNMSINSNGGDNISYHPDNAKIRKAISEAGKLRWNNVGLESKKILSEAVKGVNNPNYKDGRTLITNSCFYCGKQMIKSYHLDTPKEDIVCTSCRARTRIGVENPFYGKTHSEETRKRLREVHLGRINNVQNLLVSIDGVIYRSYTEAAKSVGCSVGTIRNRVSSDKFPNYISVDKCQTTIESIAE